MAKPKRKSADRTSADHKPLKAWLAKRRARFLWCATGTNGAPTVESWRIDIYVVLVVLYAANPGKRCGWDLFMEASTSNDIVNVLAGAYELIANKEAP